MKITQGENITWVIWVMWFYFFIRYFNLFFENYSEFKGQLKKIFHSKLKHYFSVAFTKKYEINSYEDKLINSSFFFPTFEFQEFIYETGSVGHIKKMYAKKEEIKPTLIEMVKFFSSSLYQYLFKKHYFFEYYFPILFGLSPLIIYFYKNLSVFVPLW